MSLAVTLTGGIGSGKTTVARLFSLLQIPVYNADNRAKYLVNNQAELKDEIRILLGDESFVNGVYNTKFVAGRVFSDEAMLKKLNAIIHPAVARDFAEWKQAQKSLYALREAAIAIEAGTHTPGDPLVLVTAPEKLRVQRVVERDNTTQHEVELRMKRQLTDEEKLKFATFEIKNDNQHSLIEQVLEVDTALRQLAEKNT